MKLKEALHSHVGNLHPLFIPDLIPENTLLLDFSIYNPEMKKMNFNNVELFNRYVFNKIKESGKDYGYGGYMEDREIYRRSPLFAISPDEARSIHLGVDVWVEAGKSIHCPMDARVHSFQDNDNYGDYGPTIILEHELSGNKFYTLYGHLTRESLKDMARKKIIKKGEVFCQVGNFPENGDWPPHLHFQLINDLRGKQGDFPGVCNKIEKEAFRETCPDPLLFFSLGNHQ